jgi:uncharacterized protein (DUF433 family)
MGIEVEKENRMYDLQHITSDPAILGGKPIVKGTRISVEFILELFASGATLQDVLRAYPQLTAAAVEDALRYAARSLKNEIVLTAEVAA